MNLKNLLEYELIYKKTLNPKLWKDDVLIEDVRNKLIQISNEFLKFLKIDNAFIKDIIIRGSNCNYNWTNESDLDLHILLSYSEFEKSCNNIDIESMFRSQKTAWNDGHDIKIFDIPVECYVEDADTNQNKNDSSKYSLLNEGWIVKPNYIKNLKVDDVAIDKMYTTTKNAINKILNKSNVTMKELKDYADALATMRQKSLDSDGEFGTGNLVYKKLRKSSLLKCLWDKINKLENKNLSLK